MPVIYPEVDWDRKLRPAQQVEVSSLRKDPRRNSTTTIHLAHDYGNINAAGRPTAGQQTFHLGPQQRVVGGELRFMPLERATDKVKPDQCLDPVEILRQYKSGGLGITPTHLQSTTQHKTHTTLVLSTPAGITPTSATATSTTSTHPHGVYPPTIKPATPPGQGARQLTFWDGHARTQLAPLPGHEGPAGGLGAMDGKAGWRAPASVEPHTMSHTPLGTGTRSHQALGSGVGGGRLGVAEQPGSAATHLASVKHRHGAQDSLSSLQHGHVHSTRGMDLNNTHALYSVGTKTLADQALADPIRTYGRVFKPIGHHEYEAVSKEMDGIGCWGKTGSELTSSMDVGRPSRMLSPWEHTAGKLSLRQSLTART